MENMEIEMINSRSRVLSEELFENDREERGNQAKQEPGCLLKTVRWICQHDYARILVTVFITEMGDRSQFAAITIAASYDFWVVAIGGSIGHIVVSLVGKHLSQF
jgi:putative Ca2+/H+ antiporter (TMEM165/GDT1 family)